MEDELQAELQFHLEREIEENIIRGMTPEEARYAAIRSFGGVERVKEESRDVRGLRPLEEVWQDLRYGARMLLRQPGFTVVAAITLALGIGANTAIFSVVNAVLLRPLPCEGPDRLVVFWTAHPQVGREVCSLPDFADWREQSRSFELMAAFTDSPFNLTGVGEAERLNGQAITLASIRHGRNQIQIAISTTQLTLVILLILDRFAYVFTGLPRTVQGAVATGRRHSSYCTLRGAAPP
jgi:putative ABC transport system permease protein